MVRRVIENSETLTYEVPFRFRRSCPLQVAHFGTATDILIQLLQFYVKQTHKHTLKINQKEKRKNTTLICKGKLRSFLFLEFFYFFYVQIYFFVPFFYIQVLFLKYVVMLGAASVKQLMQVTHVDITKDRQKTGWTEIELDHRRTPLYSHQITRRLETGWPGPGGRKSGLFAKTLLRFPKEHNERKKKNRDIIRWRLTPSKPSVIEDDR